MNWFKDKPIAHRGLHDGSEIPENSYAAFNAAIEFELPVEIDLQLTSDNKLIVFHDDNLLRMTGHDKVVSKCKLNKIKNLSLLNTSELIPIFTELLEEIDGRIPLLIEIKNFSRPGIFEETVLQNLQNYSGEYALQSFNPLTVRWLKLNAPKVLRGQISSRFKEMPVPLHYKYMLRNLTLNFTAKPDFINYNIDDLPYLPVELYRNYGMPILAWTVKTKAQLKKAKELCDNFVFEKLSPEDIVK